MSYASNTFLSLQEATEAVRDREEWPDEYYLMDWDEPTDEAEHAPKEEADELIPT